MLVGRWRIGVKSSFGQAAPSTGITALNNILIGVISGIAAAVLARAVVRDRQNHRRLYQMIFVLTLAICFSAIKLAAPHRQTDSELSEQMDRAFANNPVYVAIKQYEPALYAEIKNEFKTGLQSGQKPEDMIEPIVARLLPVFSKYVPNASNEAVVRFMHAMVSSLQQLRAPSGELCYDYMFPSPGTVRMPHRQLDPATQKEVMESIAQVIRSAAVAPRTPPQARDVTPYLEPIMADLREKYGPPVMQMQNPRAPDVDKHLICNVTIDLYTRILELPEDESGSLIRYLAAP